jgi:hypothetical protein
MYLTWFRDWIPVKWACWINLLWSFVAMRVYFRSLTRPKHVAERLHQLLPALSHKNALEWTAQVFGYRDWYDLQQVTKSEPEPSKDVKTLGIPSLTAIFTGDPSLNYQMKVLKQLLGTHAHLTLHLFDAWSPNESGAPRRAVLGKLGLGRPAFMLAQEEIVDNEPSSKAALETWGDRRSDGGAIVNMLPAGPQALDDFFESLRKSRKPFAGYWESLQTILNKRSPWNTSTLSLAANDIAVQSRPIPLFAVDANNKVVGCAMTSFEMAVSRDGAYHAVSIDVGGAAVLPRKDDASSIIFALGAACVHAYMMPIKRYLFSQVRNVGPEATVRFMSRSQAPIAQEMVEHMRDVIPDMLDLSLEGYPPTTGVHFFSELQPTLRH